MNRQLRSATRRATLTWRRLKAGVVDTRISRSVMAAALGVREADLPSRVANIRRALGRRLPAPTDMNAVRHTLFVHASGEVAEIVRQAERLGRHTFDLLGSGPIDLGTPIDWHCDFKSGYRWNATTHYAGIRFGETPGVDVKVPWELSRGQHLPLLAQASLLSGAPRYVEEAARQILDWIQANPPEMGVNWVSPMDVAIRAVNWLWSAGLFSAAAEIDDNFFEVFLASMLAHGRYLFSNLERPADGIKTNHYIADLVGLLYLGLCLPELDRESRWASFARAELACEMERQVFSDGSSYESSIPYHRLVAEMFLSAALVARRNDAGFAPAFLDRLSKMVEFTAEYTKSNGLAPQIGDGDDGRLHVLTGYGVADPRDHRHVLAGGAALFGREDWLAMSGERWTEALWLGAVRDDDPAGACGGSGVRPSAAFDQAGVYILRHADDVVVFTAGRVGTAGMGNHKHNDLLAIEAHLAGEDVLIDPGSYVYTPDPAARNAFRSTAAHNTVMVDRAEQNRIPASALFSLYDDATPRRIAWHPLSDGGTVSAEHDGYRRLDAPVLHRRSVTLSKGHRVQVEDAFTEPGGARASHELSWTFACAAGCRLTADVNGWIVATAARNFRLTQPCDDRGRPLSIEPRCDVGFVSPRYGVRERAPVLRWKWRGQLPLTVRFELHVL